jgi:S1-C subfamily serine protease
VPVIGGNGVEVIGGSGGGVASTGASPAVGKFGFAVECKPSCTVQRRPNGEYYFKYDGYPRIVEVRERSAADRAGLRVGDVITKVEGRSILADDALRDNEQKDQLHITLRRDGKDIEVVMLVVR